MPPDNAASRTTARNGTGDSADSSAGFVPVRRQQQQSDSPGDCQRAGVEEEGRGQGDGRQGAADGGPGHPTDQEAAPGRTRRPDRVRRASTEVSSRVNADTVNIAEPIPPTPRSDQQLRVASARSRPVRWRSPTMKMPVAMMIRSLKILISQPQKGLEIRRIRANAEMTAPTSVFPTPKLRAKTGSTGTRTPKPTATQNATRPST